MSKEFSSFTQILTSAGRKSELAALLLALEVIVEKVRVEYRLKDAAEVNNKVMLVHRLMVGSVDPVQNVERPISSHEENVIASQILHLPIPLQYNELRKDRNGLQVNGKGPKQLQEVESANATSNEVGDESNAGAWCHGELPMQKRILRFVVSRANWLTESDHVNNRSRRCNVQNLHAGVVQRVERREQVEVPRYEYYQEQLMRSDRDTCHPEISHAFASPAAKVPNADNSRAKMNSKPPVHGESSADQINENTYHMVRWKTKQVRNE